MLRIWPKESSLDDLEKEQLEADEVWEQAEAFMMKLTKPKSIQDRLKVWDFKDKWEQAKVMVVDFHKKIMQAYIEIETNKNFMRIVSMALAIGNIMNGGTAKGQADGFDIAVLSNLQNLQDNQKRSLLAYITRKLDQEDENFADSMKNCLSVVNIRETDTKWLRTKTGEMQGLLGVARGCFTAIKSANEGQDRFQDV